MIKINISEYLADRTSFTKPGEKRVMIDLAAKQKDVISLGRGDPDLSTPDRITEAGIEALKKGILGIHSGPDFMS